MASQQYYVKCDNTIHTIRRQEVVQRESTAQWGQCPQDWNCQDLKSRGMSKWGLGENSRVKKTQHHSSPFRFDRLPILIQIIQQLIVILIEQVAREARQPGENIPWACGVFAPLGQHTNRAHHKRSLSKSWDSVLYQHVSLASIQVFPICQKKFSIWDVKQRLQWWKPPIKCSFQSMENAQAGEIKFWIRIQHSGIWPSRQDVLWWSKVTVF